MQVPFDRPLAPREATALIRARSANNPDLWLTKHAKEQMAERDLLVGDILHVLRNGFVLEEGTPATQEGFFRYAMECTTPNSDGRTVRVIVIPSTANAVKIVTVMWRDENKHSG
jgi:hypothetical protein